MIYKGVVHMHSTHSYDGKMSLSELKSFLLKKGISFACMTEHTDYLDSTKAKKFIDECRSLSDENFVFVPGFEVPYKEAHVLHIGSTDFISSIANSAQLTLWRKVSPFVVLAHPIRNKYEVDERLLSVIDGVEIWNQQYEGKLVPRDKSAKLLKKLRKEKPLLAVGGLDLHRSEHYGSPITTLEIPQLTEVSIVEALKQGKYLFGNEKIKIRASDEWSNNFKQKAQSYKSIFIINLGKKVNKTLAGIGLSLPAKLKAKIRSKV